MSKNQLILRQTLHAFEVESLGEGDTHAGTNVLAAMAIVLADIAKPGSGIAQPEQGVLQTRMSLLASGPLTESLVAEKVINLLGTRQNAYMAHLRHKEAYDAAEAARPIKFASKEDITSRNGDPALNVLHHRLDFPGGLQPLKDLLRLPASWEREALIQTPFVFVDGGDRELQQKLQYSHSGHPLLGVHLRDAAHAKQLAPTLVAVMRGGTFGGASFHIKGNVIATIGASSLSKLVLEDSANWLSDFLWLTDGERVPTEALAVEQEWPRLGSMTDRFQIALESAWARRLDYGNPEPLLQELKDLEYQRAWLRFLGQLEASFPGITFACRPLFVTLLFGLRQLAKTIKAPQNSYSISGILGLAKFIASRMAKRRQAILRDSRQSRELQLALQLVHKLDTKPGNPRELVRRFHRLPLADCTDALEFLQKVGAIQHNGSQWILAISKEAALAKINSNLTYDV